MRLDSVSRRDYLWADACAFHSPYNAVEFHKTDKDVYILCIQPFGYLFSLERTVFLLFTLK